MATITFENNPLTDCTLQLIFPSGGGILNITSTFSFPWTFDPVLYGRGSDELNGTYIFNCGGCDYTVLVSNYFIPPSPTPTVTNTNTPTTTPTQTNTPTRTNTPTPSNTNTPGASPNQTPTTTPTLTPTRTPTPTQNVFTHLGRTTPDAINAFGACSTYTPTRSYYTSKSLWSLTNGDIIYDNIGLSTPTNGGQRWIALTENGIGIKRPLKIDTNGAIMEVYYCA
jgi:hypothetical protein